MSHKLQIWGLFENSSFNGDISRWNTSNVVSMRRMFSKSQFDGDISGWDTSQVNDMYAMFNAACFNRDISEWNVVKCTMFGMMFNRSNFSGDLSRWSFDPLASLAGFSVPNVYHWVVASCYSEELKDPIMMDHFIRMEPLVRSLASTHVNAAVLIQQAWLSRSKGIAGIESIAFDFYDGGHA